MARVTPQEFAEKWRRRLSNSTEDVRRGIERVTESPGQKAAQRQEAMLSGVQEAVTSGRWARRVGAVSTEDWKRATIDKGLSRIGTGAQAAESKMARVGAELLPAVDAAAAEAKQIPKDSIEGSIERAATYMRRMREFKINR